MTINKNILLFKHVSLDSKATFFLLKRAICYHVETLIPYHQHVLLFDETCLAKSKTNPPVHLSSGKLIPRGPSGIFANTS